MKYEPIRILGFVVDKRINLIAVTALVLSVGGVGWQLGNFMRGAEIILLPPNTVMLFVNICANDDVQYLEIVAPVTYANIGASGYNDVLIEERIHLEFPERFSERKVQLKGRRIVRVIGNDLRLEEHDDREKAFCEKKDRQRGQYPSVTILDVTEQRVATVSAGSSLSRAVHYSADSKFCEPEGDSCERRKKAGILKHDFLSQIHPEDKIGIVFFSNFLQEGYVSLRCTVKVDFENIGDFGANLNTTTPCEVPEPPKMSKGKRYKSRMDLRGERST